MSLPIPMLDDRSFEAFFQEARSRIPRYAPQWTNHNLSDPGMALIDIFAWLAEMQIYRTDRITDDHKIKFLKLLQTAPKTAVPSVTQVTFTIDKSEQSKIIEAGTVVSAKDSLTGFYEAFETDEAVTVTTASISKILYNKKGTWNEVVITGLSQNDYFEPFFESDTQQGKLYIGLSAAFLENQLRFRFNLNEKGLPSCTPCTRINEFIASVNLLWRVWNGESWQPLDIVADTTAGLLQSGFITVTGVGNGKPSFLRDIPGHSTAPVTDAFFWITVTPGYTQEERFEILPRIQSILLNTVSTTHGRTWKGETYDSTGLPVQTITLKNAPILQKTVTIRIEGKEWTEVDDFDGSEPTDLHYCVDYRSATIRFGDGEYGSIPPSGQKNILVEKYRAGGGIQGNVAAGLLTRIENSNIGDISLVNYTESQGGCEVETVDQALNRVRRDRKQSTRVLSKEDIERLVVQAPGVRLQTVYVLFGYHPLFCTIPMPSTVTLVVIPFSRDNRMVPRPSPGFLKRIEHYLDSRRLITTDLHVIGPKFIPISVSAQLRIQQRMKSDLVKSNAETALNSFLCPIKGGPDGKGWPIGRAVFATDIIAVLQRVEGVTCVKSMNLSQPLQGWKTDSIKIPKIGIVYPSVHTIEITAE
ncbi:putative baseplate assembly protein [bacterium]|nr:putative baseplate assembly protein [candidate division CSSED10-310 bacterium]